MLAHLSSLQGYEVKYYFVSQEHYDINRKVRVGRANQIYKEHRNTHTVLFISVHANAFSKKSVTGHEIHIAKECSKTSLRFAQLLDLSFRLMNEAVGSGIPSRKVWRKDFDVVKHTHCPAVLIEVGYMTNDNDLKHLMSESYRNTVAINIFNTIIDLQLEDTRSASLA